MRVTYTHLKFIHLHSYEIPVHEKIIWQMINVSPPRKSYYHPGPPKSARSPHFFPNNSSPPIKYGVLKNHIPPESWGERKPCISVNIDQYRSTSVNIDQYRPISTNIDQSVEDFGGRIWLKNAFFSDS